MDGAAARNLSAIEDGLAALLGGGGAPPATRVTATLREEGLVEARIGSGTVVSPRAQPTAPAAPHPATSSTPRLSDQALNRNHLVRNAIRIADTEGLDVVSMRRLAAELGVAPMSLYRHVANKDELLTQMADMAFGELELPEPGPDGWRAKLELIARRQWQLCQRHLWLPKVISFTRPLLAPNMMAQTEWTLRALDGLGLPMTTRMQEALTLHALVVALASSMAEEVEAEQDTGMTLDRWRIALRSRARELLDSGQFPLLATLPQNPAPNLNELFEYGLARHLDGFATLLRPRVAHH